MGNRAVFFCHVIASWCKARDTVREHGHLQPGVEAVRMQQIFVCFLVFWLLTVKQDTLLLLSCTFPNHIDAACFENVSNDGLERLLSEPPGSGVTSERLYAF